MYQFNWGDLAIALGVLVVMVLFSSSLLGGAL